VITPYRLIARAVFTILSENRGFRGAPDELAALVIERATPDERLEMPSLEATAAWAATFNKLRHHFIRFGYSYTPKDFVADKPLRIYRSKCRSTTKKRGASTRTMANACSRNPHRFSHTTTKENSHGKK
jgi:hypothetical protein